MEIRELLAEKQHEIWSHWMKYLFSVSQETDEGVVIPVDKVLRWKQQMITPYIALTEQEKSSDREQADKLLTVIDLCYERYD
jgi:hypothetical protein